MKQNETFGHIFNEVAKEFPIKGYLNSHSYYQHRAILAALELFFPNFEGLKLLDIGSGPMDKTALFQKMGFKCSAVDDLGDPWHKLGKNTEAIINFGKRVGIDFHLQRAGDYSIPFEFNSFDLVT